MNEYVQLQTPRLQQQGVDLEEKQVKAVGGGNPDEKQKRRNNKDIEGNKGQDESKEEE